VVGLGLVGQLTARLAMASGLDVVGIDVRSWTVELVATAGAVGLLEDQEATTEAVLARTKGRGVDAVIITASTKSSEPVMLATERVRDRGRIVIVGDVGVELSRTPFYLKEIELRFARSYGPGRYERTYEDYSVDYPIGHVRWTEGRNIEAYLDLVARGSVSVADLVTHTFGIAEAEDAYSAISKNEQALAVQLRYDSTEVSTGAIHLRTPGAGVGSAALVGAGNFAKMTFVPAMKRAGFDNVAAVTSSGGLSARHLAERHDIAVVTPSVEDLLQLDVDTVFVLSRHDSHADIAVRALNASKHVFVEKPLALSHAELASVLHALADSERQLWVGFNRRHSECAVRAKGVFAGSGGPLVANYRVSSGRLPDAHWYKDRRQGGRLLGEVCHFIDLVNWLIGAEPQRVVAVGSGRGEALLQEDLIVTMQYADGSMGTVTYAEHGHANTSKERLEVLGRGRSLVIDDFQSLSIDGRSVKIAVPGKGHTENLRAFRSALLGERDGRTDLLASLTSTNMTLAAADSLLSGRIVDIPPMRVE
jgi:predicted dehydrogenase